MPLGFEESHATAYTKVDFLIMRKRKPIERAWWKRAFLSVLLRKKQVGQEGRKS